MLKTTLSLDRIPDNIYYARRPNEVNKSQCDLKWEFSVDVLEAPSSLLKKIKDLNLNLRYHDKG